ncbi:hypothetical protein AB0M28_14060 [Streptomyces sp. NPDC051940]|uniref:hypothetical protein n=1 Tax=Streptomyces sp. NPDC051940 TaxID=3155675 RepID=UPI00342EFC6B
MFTAHQLKPRTAVSLAFTGWAHWLRCRGVSHAALITRHATGFVPVGVRVDYDEPHDFLDGEAFSVRTDVDTWQPRRFPTCQQVRCDIRVGPRRLAGVLLQMICVRIESDASLAARPGTMPAALAPLLLAPGRAADPPPRYLSRTPPPDDGELVHDGHAYPFTIHRGMCEIGDQWYFESVPDLLGAARETLVFAHARATPALLPGLSAPLRRVQYGLRRPYGFLDDGTVRTRVRSLGASLRFEHDLLTADGDLAGHAVETVPVPAAQPPDPPRQG